MLKRLLSNDLPRSPWLGWMLAAVLLGLAFAPFLFPGVKALSVAAKILVFIVLVASFDLLLGYTGIVSFAHTMFFGIGAYGVAMSSNHWGANWASLSLGVILALVLTLVLALLIGLFSLRVRAIFFAMITLAVAAAFQTLASQLSEWTGGEDGLSFKLPALLLSSTEFSDTPFWGVNLDGRLLCYYLLFAAALIQFLMLLRIVNSPFGRVLQAIRENEFRAEAIGYRVVVYRTLSSVLSAFFACMAGVMLALWLRYNGPDTSLSFEIMMDVLLIQTPHHAAQTCQAAAHHKHTYKKPANFVAQGFHHFTVLHTRANEQTHLGLTQSPSLKRKHNQPYHHGHESVFFKRRIAPQQGTAHDLG